MSDALGAAVRDAVERGVLAVPVPEEVPVFCAGPGVFESPVALRLGVDPRVIAECVGGSVTPRGFVRVEVSPGAVVDGVLGDPRYGVRVVPAFSWDEWPRTWENPGFAVRYAYVRAGWVGRWASELGVGRGVFAGGEAEEMVLVEALGELPGRAAQAERERDARPLVLSLERVAAAYHDVHERCPAVPRGDERPGAVHAGRVSLAEAARIAIGNGLNMIGETPRERL